MTMHTNIIDSLHSRQSSGRWGIGVAKTYLRDFAYGDFGISPEQWQKQLEDAAHRLTYCQDDFEIKAYKEVGSAKEGVLLEYDAVCSSRRKDRDGDVIETGGLVIDTKHPLLWQHLQHSPIGKHVEIVEQGEASWSSKFAIADTALGRDAAVLVKMGALRKSIGFKPTEFKPLTIEKDSQGNEWVNGWHITKAEVMETSLVSIPSNVDGSVFRIYEKACDGICTALSRGELKHDAVKHWAKSISDKRPVQVQGFKEETKLDTKDTGGGELPKEQDAKCPDCGESKFDSTGTCQACGRLKDGKATEVQTKDAVVPVTKGMSHYPKGSFEQVQNDLDRSARKYLRSKGVVEDDDYGWTNLYATFSDKAVVCLYEGDGKYKCYSIAYKMDNGIAKWDGEPTEVDVEPAIISKQFQDRLTVKTVAKDEPVVVKETEQPSLVKMANELCGKAIVHGNADEAESALLTVVKTYEAWQMSRGMLQI